VAWTSQLVWHGIRGTRRAGFEQAGTCALWTVSLSLSLSLSLQADQQALVIFTTITAKQPQVRGNIRHMKTLVRCV